MQNIVGAVSDVSVFSLSHQTWMLGAALREARCCHGAAALGGSLYVAGGQPARHLMHSLEQFNVGESRWTAGPPLLEERKYLGLTAHDGTSATSILLVPTPVLLLL